MIRTKIIGRLPQNYGDYDSSKTYGKKQRCFLYGCEWESKMEGNTYAPATLNTTTGEITPDTSHWIHCSGSYNDWLIDNGYKKVDANNVKDGNNTQHAINTTVINEIGNDSEEGTIKGRIKSLEESVGSGGSVDLRIAETKSEIIGNATSACDTLGEAEGLISAEVTRAQTEEEQLRTLYNNLQQSQPIPVTSLPATGEVGKIYRLAGSTSYADYMFNENDLTTPIKMAEYDNAIDDEPTAGSNNLVKSGGVNKSIEEIKGDLTVIDISVDTGYVGSWSENHNFYAGKTYLVYNEENSHTSLIFYASDNSEVYRNNNVSRGQVTEVVLEGDAVRIGGWAYNTDYRFVKMRIVAKDSFEDRIENLEPLPGKVASIRDDVGIEININKDTSQSPGWSQSVEIPKGDYVIYTGDKMRSSINIYDKNGNNLFTTGTYPNAKYNCSINDDGASIGGWSSNSDTVEFIIVTADSVRQENVEKQLCTDIIQLNSPNIYDNLILNSVRGSRIDGGTNTNEVFGFITFGDIHGLTENVTRIMAFYKRYNKYINDIVCLGDVASSTFENNNILADFSQIISIIGNHDAWTLSYDASIVDYELVTGVYVVKQKKCYDKFLPNIANWNVIQPSNAATEGKCYFYKDYTQGDAKLRIVFIDSMHYGAGADMVGGVSTQNTWLEVVLSDAKANNIPVVIASHYWPCFVSDNSELIECSYTTTEFSGADKLPDMAIEAVQSFIETGGEFVCWTVAHAHSDVLMVPTEYPQQMILSIECATYNNPFGNSARVKDTKSQDCFNFMAFDTHDKLVKLVRVGSDETKEMKQKRVLAYRYAEYTEPTTSKTYEVGLEYCG